MNISVLFFERSRARSSRPRAKRIERAPLRNRMSQAHQIDQKLAPEIEHPPPGILYVPCCRLFENALVNVVRNLVAQIVLHFGLNLFLVQRIDCRGIDAVSPKKFAMALIKLPERSVRAL